MATSVDISDLPVPPAGYVPPSAVDISDLPVPPQSANPYNPAMEPATLQLGPIDTHVPLPGWLNRTLAGIGEEGYNISRGVGQWLGMENRGQVADSQKLDAPLDATTAGKVGKFAALTPLMAIPGADTVAGSAAIGLGLGAARPSTSTKETLTNMATGTAFGAAGGWIGNKLADWASVQNAARQYSAEQQAALNAERDATFAEGSKAGYKVPPTAIQPNAVNTALESVSGKAATRQVAMAKNQEVTNALVRKDLGLPENTPISHESLNALRQKAGAVYDSVKNLGAIPSDPQYVQDLQHALTESPHLETFYPGIGSQADPGLKALVDSVNVPVHHSEGMVDAIKQLRNLSKRNFQGAFRSEGNPDMLAVAKGQRDVADAMEDLIGRHLEAVGNPKLAQEWNGARQTIAKTYSAENALHGNNVSAQALAAQLRKGKPLSGGMNLVARFATHFPEVSAIPKSGAGVSKLAASLGMAGELGASYLHDPTLAAGSLAVMGSPYATRAAILSGVGQRLLASPSYDPSLLGTAGLKALEFAGRRGALAGAVPLNQLISGGK